MTRSLALLVIFAVQTFLSTIALAPNAYGQGEKVIIHGCDGSEWESTTGVAAKGQVEIQGTWSGREANGAGEWVVTFTDSGTYEMKAPDGEWHKGKYACDSDQNPKILNLFIKESGNPQYAGQTSLVIYKVEGNSLTLASSEPGEKTRPGTFSPASGIRVLVITKQP